MFQKAMVTDQLRSGGVLEAIRMCSAGYPTRRTFDDFIDRFTLFMPSLMDRDLTDQAYVVELLKFAKLENYQIGLSKVFLRAGQMALLQTMRLQVMNEAARKIQRATRNFLYMRHRRRAALAIQTAWRAHRARQFFLHLRRVTAAIRIQSAERCRQQHMRFILMRGAAVAVQATYRMYCCRKRYLERRANMAATVIQCFWRGYSLRKPWVTLRHLLAGRVARLRLKNRKLEAARQAELAPPRKKSDVAVDTIRMMVLRVMRDKADRLASQLTRQLCELKSDLEIRNKELTAKSRENQRLAAALEEQQQRNHRLEAEVADLLQQRSERVVHILPAAAVAGGGGGGSAGPASSRSSSLTSPTAATAAAAVAAVEKILRWL